MHGFGPSIGVTTLNSTCSWLDHLVSGLILETKLHFKTQFLFAYIIFLFKLATKINLLIHYTKGTLSLLKATTAC